MPEKDITADTLILEMRKLKKQVNALDRRVRRLKDPDDVLTEDDREAVRKAKEEFLAGKTVRLA